MRPQKELRTRRARVPMAALAIGSTLVAAVGAGAAAASTELPAHLSNARALDYGAAVTVRGHLNAAPARTPLILEFAPAGSSTWRVVGRGWANRAGDYRLTARLGRSGSLRVVTAGASTATAATSPATVSAILPVRVRAGLSVQRQVLDVLSGQRTSVTGRVYPAAAGAQVALQLRRGSGWATVARAQTGQQGRYRLAYTPRHTGSEVARVAFQGDVTNAATQRVLGRLNAYVAVPASWYGPGGTTACGQQLTAGMLGVANKTLPCGTMVTLRYGGRSARVPVIDRGPYVGDRVFDLTEATKNAIGFDGTGIVWATAS